MFDKVLERMIIQYELYKKQVIIERTIKEGEVNALEEVLKNKKIKGKKEIKSLLEETKNELIFLKAKEELINRMNENLDKNLETLDFVMTTKKYPDDVQARINANLCALKRPGKGGFKCSNELVKGTKYCKEHLKQYDLVTYCSVFPDSKNKESGL